MIASLRGNVVRIDEEWAVIEVGGVGYQVYIHPRTAAVLRTNRGEVTLQVHTAVREDAISLYGFLNSEELACFRFLLGVERIGPKAALAILSRSEWQALVDAIMTENYDVLAAVPGIGSKTARRIVLELKGRVDSLTGANPGPASPAPATPIAQRAVEALVGLGFPLADARRAVSLEAAESTSDMGAGLTLEMVVRAALRRLGPSESGKKP